MDYRLLPIYYLFLRECENSRSGDRGKGTLMNLKGIILQSAILFSVPPRLRESNPMNPRVTPNAPQLKDFLI